MLYKTLSAAVYGIDASIIEGELDVSGIRTSEDHFNTVGLPDAAVRESRDRVRAALKNCGYDIPPTHITINLAPADIRKEGSGFDLPMALGILGAYGGLTPKEVGSFVLVGELSLDGGIRGVRGALPIAIAARARKIPNLVVPEINPEAARQHKGIIANPNCSTIAMVVPLFPLHKAFRVKRVHAATYQAASGGGAAAMLSVCPSASHVLSSSACATPFAGSRASAARIAGINESSRSSGW